MGMTILAQSPGKPLSVGAAGVLRRHEQGSAAFPWSLAPAALCVQLHGEELLGSACSWCQAAGWHCGMAPGGCSNNTACLLGGLFEGPRGDTLLRVSFPELSPQLGSVLVQS